MRDKNGPGGCDPSGPKDKTPGRAFQSAPSVPDRPAIVDTSEARQLITGLGLDGLMSVNWKPPKDRFRSVVREVPAAIEAIEELAGPAGTMSGLASTACRPSQREGGAMSATSRE